MMIFNGVKWYQKPSKGRRVKDRHEAPSSNMLVESSLMPLYQTLGHLPEEDDQVPLSPLLLGVEMERVEPFPVFKAGHTINL